VIFVHPFLVVDPTHNLVQTRVHCAHRLKSAALDEWWRTYGTRARVALISLSVGTRIVASVQSSLPER